MEQPNDNPNTDRDLRSVTNSMCQQDGRTVKSLFPRDRICTCRGMHATLSTFKLTS